MRSETSMAGAETPEDCRGPAGRRVRLPDGEVHYLEAGPRNGKPVILVHGFSVPSYMWELTLPALAAAGLRALAPDLYGRGLSARPRAEYGAPLYVRQLDAFADALGLTEPFALAGCSMGGAVAAAYAAARPGRVERLALVAPLWESLPMGALGLPVLGRAAAALAYFPGLAERQLDDFADPGRFPDWPERFREQERLPGFRRALLSSYRHFLSRDPAPFYRKVAEAGIPACQIWGREDRVLRLEGAAFLEKVLGAAPLWVDGAGHLPQYEKSAEVNPALAAFLSRGL